MGFLQCNILKLRSIEPSDLNLLLAIENDSEEWVQSENYTPFSKTVMESYVRGEHDLVKFGQYRFMIELKNTIETVGCIDLFNYSSIHSRAGIGIYIVEKHRSNGYARKALSLISSYCKEVLNIELLYCSILESNKSSLSVFKSENFEETGERKSWAKVGGKRVSVKLLQKDV